jgi:hypothetical protein
MLKVTTASFVELRMTSSQAEAKIVRGKDVMEKLKLIYFLLD